MLLIGAVSFPYFEFPLDPKHGRLIKVALKDRGCYSESHPQCRLRIYPDWFWRRCGLRVISWYHRTASQ